MRDNYFTNMQPEDQDALMKLILAILIFLIILNWF